jgi:hypothetical protein
MSDFSEVFLVFVLEFNKAIDLGLDFIVFICEEFLEIVDIVLLNV